MDELDDEAILLNVLAEQVLPQAGDGRQLACCPTMDLVAVGTADDRVHVYRLNGQRVFGAAPGRQPAKVRQMHWKPSGEIHSYTFCLC